MDLWKDKVMLERNGIKSGPYDASVQRKIIIVQSNDRIDEGDIIIQLIDNTEFERFVVTDSHFQHSPSFMSQIPPHSRLEYVKERKLKERKGKSDTKEVKSSQSITYNFNGNHARLNQDTTDNSINISIESRDEVFDELTKTLKENISTLEDYNELKEIIERMRSSQGQPEKMTHQLGEFLTKGAKYTNIISPYITLLSTIASGV